MYINLQFVTLSLTVSCIHMYIGPLFPVTRYKVSIVCQFLPLEFLLLQLRTGLEIGSLCVPSNQEEVWKLLKTALQ